MNNIIEPKEYDKMLVKAKHGDALSDAEIEVIGRDVARINSDYDAYALLRLFAAYYPPTPQNVEILERFLDKTKVSDRNMLGAIMGASHSWSLSGVSLEKLRFIADPCSEISHGSSMFAAMSALSNLARRERAAAVELYNVYCSANTFRFIGELDRENYFRVLLGELRKVSLHLEHLPFDEVELNKLPGLEECIRILKVENQIE